MAYRRKSRARKTSSRSVRRSGARVRTRRTRSTGRSSRGRSSAPRQTVRIVIEQPNANTISRPQLAEMIKKGTRKPVL